MAKLSPQPRYVADIFCENETITRIDRNISAPPDAEVIDAKGKFVFPGFIDPHVHIYLPFMGTFSKDTYETGQPSRARRRHHDAHRDVLPGARDDALEVFETLDEAGRRQVRVRFHVPHGRDEVRRRGRDATSRNRQARHQLVQNFSRLQRRVRRGRHGTLSHAEARQGTRRHRHRALRKRNAHRRTSEGIARRRQNRARHSITRAARPPSKPRACII